MVNAVIISTFCNNLAVFEVLANNLPTSKYIKMIKDQETIPEEPHYSLLILIMLLCN